MLISSNSNIQLADSKLCRTPSVVLNPALHSAAGNVPATNVIYSPSNGTGRGTSAREKELQQQYPTTPTLATSGSDTERCSSQNSVITAPVRQQQQSKKKFALKDQVKNSSLFRISGQNLFQKKNIFSYLLLNNHYVLVGIDSIFNFNNYFSTIQRDHKQASILF